MIRHRRTYFYDFLRDDGETEVTVEFSMTPYDSGNTYGPAENCYPPEGGEVEPFRAFGEDGKIELMTDAEWDRAAIEIQQLPWDTWDDGGPDYD
jgi:hypothetical protein